MAKFTESTDDTERLKFLDDGTALVIRYSLLSGKFNKAIIQMTEKEYRNWHDKKILIQDALPQLDDDEREFLMTGYTPDDWTKMFPPEDEG